MKLPFFFFLVFASKNDSIGFMHCSLGHFNGFCEFIINNKQNIRMVGNKLIKLELKGVKTNSDRSHDRPF